MALSAYNIKKWYRMLTGKSEMHVHQTMGTQFIPGKVVGYFNNMTEKVLMEPELVDNYELPMNHAEQGDVIFPVTIFQYALGCYDLFLETRDEKYKKKFLQLAKWAVENQETNGAWNNFGFIYPDAPYGSMCQGEGASLLARAYIETKETLFLNRAKEAINFMILPIEKGGTAKFEGKDILFYEFTNKPVVLNGWAFSLFGLYDANIITNGEYKDILSKSIDTLVKYLPRFDNGYWSMYDLHNKIASPFYHDLHIAQLEALYKAFEMEDFKKYKESFEQYKSKRFNKNKAFIVKALQKIREK